MDKKEFSKFLTDTYSRGALMLSIGIGHDLGLWKVLCEADNPMSLQEIADKTNLKERYTKEWLSSMVAGGVIHQDRDTGLFTVPESYREELKLRASFAPGLVTWSNRIGLVKKCFSKDGPYGFGFEEEPTWFEWFKNYRATMADHALETELIPRLTDQGIIPKLDCGIKVLDIGCGVGSFTIGLARRFPNSHFIGLEYAKTALEQAKEQVKNENIKNIEFVLGDAHNLPDSWTGQFGWVFVYDTLHDLPNPHKALGEIYKVLKDDGSFSLVEIGFHSNPVDNAGDMTAAMYYSLSMFACLPSTLSAGGCVGYGAGWGREEIEKAILGAKFKIQGRSSMVIQGAKVFFYCTK